jgi:hypothetical protein
METTAVIDRVFEPISRCLTPAVARRIVKLRADPKLDARIHELAEKANEGQLSTAERAEYDTYVRAIHFFTVLQSKARRLLKGAKV